MSEIIEAVKRGDAAEVARLLDSDRSLLRASENGVSAILLAVYHGKKEIARLFIDRGAELTFHDAIAAGEIERARRMLDDDPSLLDSRSTDGYPALGLAIFFGQREFAKELIARGADVNQQAQNAQRVAPLHAAAAVRDHEIVQMLLERGADANARQQSDYTPMHTAAGRGDRVMAELLLRFGAEKHPVGSDGLTPADVAAGHSQNEIATWLRGLT